MQLLPLYSSHKYNTCNTLLAYAVISTAYFLLNQYGYKLCFCCNSRITSFGRWEYLMIFSTDSLFSVYNILIRFFLLSTQNEVPEIRYRPIGKCHCQGSSVTSRYPTPFTSSTVSIFDIIS